MIYGKNCKNGNRIFVLPDEQLPSNYNEYDLLLNIPSYELLEYSKILETDPEPTWHSIGNLEGPKGSTGPQGPVGPQGPQGPIGPQGPAGDVTATQLHELIQGSDTVVADLTEDGQHIEIHLDNNITTEIHNSLQKPTTTPSTTQIVAVDNTNAQTMLNIGDGLSVENGSLKASGGTGGKKYMHYIRFVFSIPMGGMQELTSIGLNIQFISTKSDKFTKETLFNFLQDEYNDPNSNPYFIYSPATIPNNINISKVFFIRDNNVSLSKITIGWYETGNNELQSTNFTKDTGDFFIVEEHIFEL